MTPFTSRTRLILQHRPSAHLLAAAVITYIVIATSAMATVTTVQAAPSSPAGDTVQRSDRVSDVGENSRPIWRPGPPFLPPNTVVSPFLLEATDVQAMVTGPVAHVVVTQTWNNPNGSPVDGLYIFPLPENAAVTDLSLRVGNRHITGRMLRREEARAVYETARAEGRIAGLLDQERPNIFAQQVANIMPGVTVDVVLSFDHEITCADGSCEYVFPTVVGPRFIPASQASPGRIAPPVVNEGAHTLQRLTLAVDIDAGVTVRDVTSPSHRITLTRTGDTQARAEVAEGTTALLNRDFRLRWKLGGDAPELGVLAWRDAETPGEPGVFSLIIEPPAHPTDEVALPRELVFVMDCSGSMSGVPIEAAKNVVRKSLRALRPQDTFQILRFSENVSGLGRQALAPTPANLKHALTYLDGLRGQGGTHMLAGVEAALTAPRDPERLRIVAFLTDGYIGNERDILGAVRSSIGDARLFSFGIGSSVNRYLLEGLAREGRGVAAFLGPRETPDEMVDRFIRRLATPVLTDIRIAFEDVDVQDLEPGLIPDLFAGQAVIVHGRFAKPGTGLVRIEGRVRGRTEVISRVLILPERRVETAAIGRLWARARIERLERELHDGPRADVQEAIVQLGLRHHLMTAWTSLVAVDTVVSNHGGESTSVQVPVEMPEDVAYEGIFGQHDRRQGPQQHAAKRGVSGLATASAPVARALNFASTPPPATSGAAAAMQSLGSIVSVEAKKPAAERINATSAADAAIWRDKNEEGRDFIADDEKAATADLAGTERRDGHSSTIVSPAPVSGPDSGLGSNPRDGDKRVDARGAGESNEPFARLVLVTASGLRVEVEGDGEVWVVEASRRTRIHVLDTAALEWLRGLLAAAGAGAGAGEGNWRADSGEEAGERLIVERRDRTMSLPLPAGDHQVTTIVNLMTSWIPSK